MSFLHNPATGFLSLFLLFAPAALPAQIPSIADVPDCLRLPESTRLSQRRSALVQQRDQIKGQVASHNNSCGSVPAGSPAEQSCKADQGKLNSQVGLYAAAVREFNNQVESAIAGCQPPRGPRTKIGVASSVKGTLYWLTSDGRKVPITNGSPIYMDERLVSEADGHMQILLLDETVFTIEPDSDLVVDDFVYDPATHADKFFASVVKGTFRFVTGNMTRKDPEQMKIKLPVVAIGIRGTDFEVDYHPGAEGYIKLFKGELQLTEEKTAARFPMHAGEMLLIHADGRVDRPVAMRP